jgi:hypothetical protein
MKYPLLFFLFTLPFTVSGQDHFLKVSQDSFPEGWGANLHREFKTPDSCSSLTFFTSEIDSISNYDLSLLRNLEWLVVKFSFDPAAGDTTRIPFVTKTHDAIMNLAAFSKCPKLKAIVFTIGEQIYLSDAEKKAMGLDGDKEYPEKVYKKMTDKNLENAWRNFGSELHQKLPNVTLYAYDWGW